MKKLLTILLMIITCRTSAYALTLCAKNNTYVGILRKSVNGTVSDITNTSTKKQWAVEYNYKTITGYAACNEISGTTGVAQTNLYTTAADEGQYCWCEMWPIYDYDDTTHYSYETGITSYWVFLSDFTTAESCASGCTSACATAMATNTSFRSAVFESVW